MSDKINDLQIIVLDSAVKAAAVKKAKAATKVGVHKVDSFTVKISAEDVTRFEDESYTPTVSIPLKDTLALFAQYSGITRTAALKHLKKAMTDAVKGNKKADILSEKDFSDVQDQVLGLVESLPKAKRTGKVKVNNVRVEVVK